MIKLAARDIAFRTTHCVKKGMALFIPVFYAAEGPKKAFKTALARELEAVGVSLRTVSPTYWGDGGDPLYITLAADNDPITLVEPPIVDGRIDPVFLKYLNIHRDAIQRDKLRFLLLIDARDEATFILEAGDLWDFKQHTYWL